ncbi:hypothetical protein [Georgenia alba]|uniref:Uncharacterized protein n=1 Tax=Georgenia alba TaxID=2233858 RepID=A0ABW2QG95_9MICO
MNARAQGDGPGLLRGGVRPWAAVLVGAVAGLAWAAALRAYMAELAGSTSEVGWAGTFLAILLPGALTGGVLGWAHARGRRPAPPRWPVLAPLPFAVAPLFLPGALADLFSSALGLGALAVALYGIAGGYALSGRGSRLGRALCAVPTAAVAIGIGITPPLVGGPDLTLTEPRGAWVAVLGVTLMVLAAVACSIPWRSAGPVQVPSRRSELRHLSRSRS